jgi:ABC-2 type transport system ATP-binding protein
MSDATVSATGLSRAFGHRRVVNDVTFELRQGEVLGFLGPNGAGKSTTMQMLTGNLAPTAGSVEICGIDLLERPKAAKTSLGFLPEAPPLYRELTVDEYLAFAARLHRVPKRQVRAAVDAVKDRCGLGAVGRRLIGSLSRGFQQRVGIAQAIVHNPRVIILDEPTVGLDPIQIREIRGLIRELGGEHSVILSTHILPEVESVCDRVQIMHRGELVFSGSVEELKERREGDILTVVLGTPPSADGLLGIDGIDHVEALGEGRFRIHCPDGAAAAEAIARAAVAGGWGLRQLCPEPATLEEVFIHLTPQERDEHTEAR